MVVVVIIAVLAAISVPLFVAKMRERRAQQTALQLAGLYREARMRALGRGAAVLVDHDSGTDTWTVKEGVEGTTESTNRTGNADCKALPTRGCVSNSWGTADTSRQIASFKPSDVTDVTADFSDSTSRDVCFSPLGRAFVRSGSGVWAPLTSVISIDVQRGADGLNRRVVVLPNGTARLGL
jgi:Tfp pilus assembly protein FimT